LEILNFSGNKITSIKNLEEMAGSDYRVSSIDMRDNCLHDLRELSVLNGLVGLAEIFFRDFEDLQASNPFCKNKKNYLSAIEGVRASREGRVRVDGRSIGEHAAELKDLVWGQEHLDDPVFERPERLVDPKPKRLGAGQGPILQVKNQRNELLEQIDSGLWDNPKPRRGGQPVQPCQKKGVASRSLSKSQDAKRKPGQGRSPSADKPKKPTAAPNFTNISNLHPNANPRDAPEMGNLYNKIEVLEEQLRTMATYNYTQAHAKVPPHYDPSTRPYKNPQNPPQNDFQKENFNTANSHPIYTAEHHEFSRLTEANEKFKLENYHLKNLHAETESQKIELNEKLDRNDKYWLQRVKCLEDSLTSSRASCSHLTHTTKTQESSLQKSHKETLLLTRDIQTLNSSAAKTETKLDSLQARLGDLMQANNKLMILKDSESTQSQKWQNELKVVRGTNDELKSLLKDKENHYIAMSKDTLRVNEDGIKKFEELKRD
jgi:hypothetical protein